MKYKSEIFEVLHENAVEMYKIGGITEASMREYNETCLSPETSADNDAQGNIAPETVNIEHAELVTA
jgi:putative transcriptional regulator